LLTAGIQIIGNNFIRGPTIQGLVQADDEFQKVHGLRRSQSVGLLYDSRSGSLVTNGRPGQLQFFSVDSGCQLLNVCTSLLHVIYTHTLNLKKIMAEMGERVACVLCAYLLLMSKSNGFDTVDS